MHNNDSALNKLNTTYQFQDGLESRIIANIPVGSYAFGIAEGDVIYFDLVSSQFRKSQANSPIISEVYGIVESINLDKSLNVVLNGSVKISESNLINLQYSDNIGGNDVYFLSERIPGKLQNYGPTFSQTIIKPLYIAAPHGKFTGLFKNYLGFLNPIGRDPGIPSTFYRLANFSQDGLKSVWFNELNESFSVRENIHSLNNFTYNILYEFRLNEIQKNIPTNINFIINENYEIKLSNDGNNILIFNKLENKLFHIVNGTKLVAVIEVELPGSSSSKILEVDDELTCFIVGSTSLNRINQSFDNPISAPNISSIIEYWRRSPNNSLNLNRWKKTFKQNALGAAMSIVPSGLGSQEYNDEIYARESVNRLSSLANRGKNFAISCKTLIEDQKLYKSKISHISENRYTTNIRNLIGSSSSGARSASGFYSGSEYTNGITYSVLLDTGSYLSSSSPFINHTIVTDNPINKKYCCTFGIDQCHILQKNGSYYHENQSHKKRYFKYDTMIAKPGMFDTSYSYYNNLPGRTLSSSIKQLVQLEIADELLEGIEYLTSGGSNTVQIPTYERNALHSSCSITENFSLFALLYEYKKTSSTQISKQLIILKYPVFAVDNLNTLMGYQTSNVYGRVIPNDGSGYGYVTSFRTTSIGTQKIGEYAYFYNREKIPCVFSGENVITSIDIDAINYFKIFTSNSRFFLCFPSHVIVWSYSSSSYQIISAANFDKAIFYYNTNNEFFKIENEIFRYDTSTNNFVLQGL